MKTELFLVLGLFTACLYHFLFWRYLNSSMVSFSSDILLPLPISNDLKVVLVPNSSPTSHSKFPKNTEKPYLKFFISFIYLLNCKICRKGSGPKNI